MRVFRRYNVIRFIKTAIIFFAIVGLFYFLYARNIGKVEFYRRYHGQIQFINKLSNILYVHKMIFPSKLERYDLFISQKKLESLNNSLPKTYENQILTDEYKKTVGADFFYKGKNYDVNVRYRGDLDNHWRDPQKSWLLDFPKTKYFNQAEKINLIIPVDRYYLLEELSNYRARKFGLAVPDSKFVNLFVNGNREGVYWQVESFGKDILEKQNIPGDINLYGDIDFWRSAQGNFISTYTIHSWKKYSQDALSGDIDNYSDLDTFFKVLNNPSDEYFNKNISSIIDMEDFYHWQIQQYLVGSTHQTGDNMRMYFDTTMGKFKFMPWDVSRESPAPELLERKYNPLITRILRNPKFLHERNKILWEYVGDDKNLQDDLRRYDELDAMTKNDFYKDTKKVESNYTYRKKISEIRKQIQDYFFQLQKNVENANAFVVVNINEKRPEANVEIGTTGFSSLELSGIQIKGKECNGAFSLYEDTNANGELDSLDKKTSDFACENGIYAQSKKIFLYSEKDDLDLQYFKPAYVVKNIFLVADKNGLKNLFSEKTLKFEFKNAVTGKDVMDITTKYILENLNMSLGSSTRSLGDFAKENPEFRIVGDTIYVPAGTYIIKRNIIIPKDTTLIIDPGAKFLMGENISILSYSSVVARGQASLLIEFKGVTQKPWGTFAIVDAGGKSMIDYAHFSGGGEAILNGIHTTGMFSVFRSEIEINNSEFTNANGDDGLNIKYTKGLVHNSKFANNSFDALDLDVNNSVIENNLFENNGNDGIDISSSQPVIRGNIIINSGDKCISVGENSKAIIFNNLLNGCNIGIASKDMSDPVIVNTTFINNKTAFEGYQKKQIFGGSSAMIINSILWNNKKFLSVEPQSHVNISHSVVQESYPGQGNISVDPRLDINMIARNEEIHAIIGKDIYAQYKELFQEKNTIGYSK